MTARPDLLGDLADELELDGSVTPHAAAVEAATALDVLRAHRWQALRLLFAPGHRFDQWADDVMEQRARWRDRDLRLIPGDGAA
jgi:hypothetical protein